MCSFDYPTPGTCATLFLALLFIAPAQNDRFEFRDMNDASHFVIVVAQVQAQADGFSIAWRAHHAHQRDSNQFHVMPVGWRNLDCQGQAGSFSKHAALDAAFGAVDRAGAGFPLPTTPSSWRHRVPANPS
jgi:hypothetical protein